MIFKMVSFNYGAFMNDTREIPNISSFLVGSIVWVTCVPPLPSGMVV